MLVEISQRALCLLVCPRCLFVCMPIVLAASLFVWLRVGLFGGCAQFDHVNGGNQRFGQSVAGEKNTRLMKSLHHIAQTPFPHVQCWVGRMATNVYKNGRFFRNAQESLEL